MSVALYLMHFLKNSVLYSRQSHRRIACFVLFVCPTRQGGGLSPAAIQGWQVSLCNTFLQHYIHCKTAIFRNNGGSKPPPYGVEIVLEYLLIKLSCALYLSYALFTKIKEPTHIKVSSSLLRFLTRKRTGYGAEPRKKACGGSAPKKRYGAEPRA